MRGLGKSTSAALISFFGTCVFRIAWVYTVFAWMPNLACLYLSYPASYLLTFLSYLVVLLPLLRRIKKDALQTT
jgi:Na+-driven multidrug efflux pump